MSGAKKQLQDVGEIRETAMRAWPDALMFSQTVETLEDTPLMIMNGTSVYWKGIKRHSSFIEQWVVATREKWLARPQPLFEQVLREDGPLLMAILRAQHDKFLNVNQLLTNRYIEPIYPHNQKKINRETYKHAVLQHEINQINIQQLRDYINDLSVAIDLAAKLEE